MQILLPAEISNQLVAALSKAGDREIGGILMGEHISDSVFAVQNLTIQRHGGTMATFMRRLQEVVDPLRRFFDATRNNYTRFNYLGEWHSHPRFAPEPSSTDHRTMRTIVEDPEVGANFVVLLVVKLNPLRDLFGTVTVYQRGLPEFSGSLVLEREQ